MTATVFDIQRASFVDGPGIRTTVFFKGCNLRCAWCHNPEIQSARVEMLFHENRCTKCGKCKVLCPYSLKKCDFCGKCSLYCPQDSREICGKKYTAEEVLYEVVKDLAVYESSGGRVTFSGGECMLQIDFLEAVLKACKSRGIHTAVDTAGQVPFDYFERVIPFTDLFLYDVKCFDSEKHRQYTGAPNGLILSNLEKLLNTGKDVWVRIPIIPTVNDSEEELLEIKNLLLSFSYPKKVELLPYHALGAHKYAALGKRAAGFTPPDAEKMRRLEKVFL